MLIKIITLLTLNFVCAFDLNESLISALVQSNSPSKVSQTNIPNIASRLGEPVLLECGTQEHELLKQLESSVPSMPVLVNWFKHYSLTRRSDKPFYAKYLANNIDYAPHISRDYENRIQVVNKINLNISSLKAVDEALYECRLILFDKAYADSQTGSMFYLQVQIAPEFEYPNEEIVYFKPNIPVRLYCYAKGKPTPTISWYKNGKQLDANSSVLQETFSSNEISDIFEYRCKAENKVGLIEHTIKVIRSGSLFFTEPLKNLTVTEGTILNWPCLAQSNTEITYKWFKDSVSVQSHLYKWSDRGALFQDGMLYLLETYRNDSGFYECHAFTANKRIETSAFLNVLYGPEILPFQSPFYVFENSQMIVIDCVVKSNPAIISLEWFKDQHLLSNTAKYEILPNNSLLIRNPTKRDEGNYYCSCNNTIKKTVSPIIKVEIIETKNFEKISFSTSNNQFKLPCVTRTFDTIPTADNINWFKINSKLPLNRYTLDSNGSLVIYNLKSIDSGYYYCRLKNEYSSQEGILVKLFVLKNKTFDSSESLELNRETTELPLCPQKVKLNQTKNGILISWSYPDKTPIKIEYFQIYFREINEKTNPQLSKKSNLIQSSINYEWKTTESINSNIDNYLIDDSELEIGKIYEFQLVSFSTFSKSLPSSTYKLKYRQTDEENLKLSQISIFTKPTTISYINGFSFISLGNFSQLDLILAAIFLILIFVLIICITACVVFRQSNKKLKDQKKGEIDDWGFQSSAVTTTFLSSSSSEKSTSLDSFSQKNKLYRNPEVELNLTRNERKILNNQNLHVNITESRNEEDDLFDDGDDYYYSKPKFQKNTLKSRNFSCHTQSTTTGISSNPNSNSSTYSSSSNTQKNGSDSLHSPNFINTSGGSTSGITSASATSSLINSDDNNDDLTEKLNDISINTIKYNAKTNILSTQEKTKIINNKEYGYKSGQKKKDHLLLNDNYSKNFKSSLKRNQNNDVSEHFVNEYSGISLDVDTSNSDLKKNSEWSHENSPIESNYSSPNELDENNKTPIPPFPTNHFNEKNATISCIPLEYFNNQNVSENIKYNKNSLSSESTNSSSSGCSSMETQQIYVNHEVNKFCTLVNKPNLNVKKKNVNFVTHQRNSICSDLLDLKSKTFKTIDKKELIYSTNYKPVIKSSLLKNENLAKKNLIEESPKRNYQTSTFKPSKIDYV